jgi:SSS family solute:Na+ symporter
MRDDGVTVTALKQQRYHHVISLEQYNAAIAPIRERHGLIFDFWNIHWLYSTQILLVVTAVLMITISMLTKAPGPRAAKFTWYGATPEEKAATRASWSAADVWLSVIVLAAVLLFYIEFW